ncbi:MAG: hypothetical protein ACR2QW_11455, partial [bacterium]
ALIGEIKRNTSKGESAEITDSTQTTLTGTLSGAEDWDTNDKYEIVCGLAGAEPVSGDKIHGLDTVTLNSGDGSYTYKFYLEDVSASAFSRMYTINDTAAGAPDGTYDASLSVKGVLTLTLQPEAAGGKYATRKWVMWGGRRL